MNYKIYYLESSQQHLGWAKVFKDLVDYYIDNFNVELIHKKSKNGVEDEFIYVKELEWCIQDCELVIHNVTTDSFKIISWREGQGWRLDEGNDIIKILGKRNNPNDILLVAHISGWFFHPPSNKLFIPKTNYKIKTTPWYTFNAVDEHLNFIPTDYDSIFSNRKNVKLIDKLFFKSSTVRKDPYKLAELGICNSDTHEGKKYKEYLIEASQYKVGLAISSNAEKCYREIEYMAIGLPFMRLDYIGDHFPPLIPDYHYISINREKYSINPKEWTADSDLKGGPKYVEAYKQRFLEVKDDIEFLDYISCNAREYYKTYCDPLVRINTLLELLEEK